MTSDSFGSILRDYGRSALMLAGFALLLVGIEVLDTFVLHGALDALGIHPRSVEGLAGIVLAPFLHGNLAHVLANASSIVVLGALLLLRGPRIFWWTSILTILVSGLGTWAVGAPHSVHLGASGLIFGWLASLLLAGWYERRFATMALSVVCLVAFGSMVFGVLPGQPGISWEAHLFGFLGGMLSARLVAPRGRPARRSARSL